MNRVSSVLLLLLAIAAAPLAHVPLGAQPVHLPRVESARGLVVGVRGWTRADERPPADSVPPDSAPAWGSGIVLGYSADSLYVATAYHVVVPTSGLRVRGLSVVLDDGGGPPRVATVRNVERDLDLAVLSVPLAYPGERFDLPLSRLGDPGGLRLRQPLYPIGCPEEGPCVIPAAPSLFRAPIGAFFSFESSNVVDGYSGGGLFTARGRLVGMISETAYPSFRALRADTLLARAAAWGVPVELAAPARDPFTRTYSAGAALRVGAVRRDDAPFSFWVERTADVIGPLQQLLAIRASVGSTERSLGLHGGVGVRWRSGTEAGDGAPAWSAAAFLDGGATVRQDDAPINGGTGPTVGWAAGLGLRWQWRAGPRQVMGVVLEVRKQGSSWSSHTTDAFSLGVSLGIGR